MPHDNQPTYNVAVSCYYVYDLEMVHYLSLKMTQDLIFFSFNPNSHFIVMCSLNPFYPPPIVVFVRIILKEGKNRQDNKRKARELGKPLLTSLTA